MIEIIKSITNALSDSELVSTRLGRYTPDTFSRTLIQRIKRDREQTPAIAGVLIDLGPVLSSLNNSTLEEGYRAVLKALAVLVDKKYLTVFKTEKGIQKITWMSDIADHVERLDTVAFTHPEYPPEDHSHIQESGKRSAVTRRPVTVLSDEVLRAMNIVQNTPYCINSRVLQTMLQCSSRTSTSTKKAIDQALLIGNRRYYLRVFCDWRGRIYTDSRALLSYQGDDPNRALCQYKEYVDVDTEDILFAKEVIKEEYGEYVATEYKAIANDPISFMLRSEHTSWCALAGAMALEEAERTGRSRYILQQDASCSGFQHIASIMGDEELARETNIIGNSGDLYTSAAKAVEHSHLNVENEVDQLLQRHWPTITSRNAAKGVVMLTGYGSSARGIAKSWLENMGYKVETTGEKENRILEIIETPEILPNHLLKNMLLDAQKNALDEADVLTKLAEKYQKALLEKYPSISRFVNCVRNAAKDYFDMYGVAIRWDSPSAMRCIAAKCTLMEKLEPLKVQATSGKIRLNVSIPGNQLNEQATGAAPNLIHSIDAALVHYTILAMSPVSPIHDSFGTHMKYAKELAETVREEMIKLDHWNYFLRVVTEEWGAKVKANLRNKPLDTTEVRNGMHIH